MDKTELKSIVERHASSVYHLAYVRTGSRADAEDVMQDTFLRLLRAEPEFRDDAHCRAWLLRVAANRAADLFRAPWRRVEALEESVPAAEEDADAREVVEAVLALPRQYRAAVHLFYYEGYSAREIGAVLHKSEQAVRNLLHRARGMLKERLKGVVEDDGD